MLSHAPPATAKLRLRACVLCLTAVLAFVGAAPAMATAASLSGGGALNELTEAQREETKTATTGTTASTSSTEPTNSHTLILLVLAAAVLLLSGIAFFIVRDARRVAPATEREMIQGSSASDTAAQLRKRRAKAKAARKQRKRNR